VGKSRRRFFNAAGIAAPEDGFPRPSSRRPCARTRFAPEKCSRPSAVPACDPLDGAYIFWYTMSESERKLDAVFFRTDRDTEPVRDWLLSLTKSDRKIIGDDVLKVQYCWPIRKPLVGNLGGGLWEVRSNLGSRIARVIFCIEGEAIVLLHGFIKKTQKTPKHELGLAAKRKKQLM
jgi:phage-related protein